MSNVRLWFPLKKKFLGCAVLTVFVCVFVWVTGEDSHSPNTQPKCSEVSRRHRVEWLQVTWTFGKSLNVQVCLGRGVWGVRFIQFMLSSISDRSHIRLNVSLMQGLRYCSLPCVSILFSSVMEFSAPWLGGHLMSTVCLSSNTNPETFLTPQYVEEWARLGIYSKIMTSETESGHFIHVVFLMLALSWRGNRLVAVVLVSSVSLRFLILTAYGRTVLGTVLVSCSKT